MATVTLVAIPYAKSEIPENLSFRSPDGRWEFAAKYFENGAFPGYRTKMIDLRAVYLFEMKDGINHPTSLASSFYSSCSLLSSLFYTDSVSRYSSGRVPSYFQSNQRGRDERPTQGSPTRPAGRVSNSSRGSCLPERRAFQPDQEGWSHAAPLPLPRSPDLL